MFGWLTVQEDELTRSIGSCRVEADVVNKWIKFLEDTWIIQSKFAQQKEIQVTYVLSPLIMLLP